MNKKFAITITEVLSKKIIVEASNEYEALDLVETMYKNAEESCVLSAEDHQETEFKID